VSVELSGCSTTENKGSGRTPTGPDLVLVAAAKNGARDGGGDDDVLRRLVRASSRAMPFEGGAMHIFVSTRGLLYEIGIDDQSRP
jgi:hypothetical protein